MNTNIHIIRPASREANDLLSGRIDELTDLGWQIEFDEMPIDRNWPFTSSTAKERLAQLGEALDDPKSEIIWSARGGYGCSDLLDKIPWPGLVAKPAKLIVGFSDVSALHSAFYSKLNWPGLHAPMPATTLWRQNPEDTDVDATLLGLRTGEWNISVKLHEQRHYLPNDSFTASGKLFGGCFSVLTNLIGTPYFPKSLQDHILFLEDTGENPGRLARFLNQWRQSGALQGVKALVLGSFRDCAEPGKDEPYVYRMFANQSGLPTFVTDGFGHISPNMPLMIGAHAHVNSERLNWTYSWSKTNTGIV